MHILHSQRIDDLAIMWLAKKVGDAPSYDRTDIGNFL
jgi:hypothetical protein